MNVLYRYFRTIGGIAAVHYRGPMSTKPEDKNSLEDVVRLLCEYVGQMSEEEKAQLRYELLNGAEVPPHMRWEN